MKLLRTCLVLLLCFSFLTPSVYADDAGAGGPVGQAAVDNEAAQSAAAGQAQGVNDQGFGFGNDASGNDYYPNAIAARGCSTLLSAQMSYGARDITTSPRGQVSILQAYLAYHYGIPMQDILTGYFGDLTRTYVIRFQQEKQILPAEGIVGPKTRAAIAVQCEALAAEGTAAISIQYAVQYGRTGSISARGCSIPQGGSCAIEVEWMTAGLPAEKIDIGLTPPGGVEYLWSRIGYPQGAPTTTKTSITHIMTPGIWKIQLYEFNNNNKVLDSIEVPVALAPTSTNQSQSQTYVTQPAVNTNVSGTLTARACIMGDQSLIAPNNTLVCDSSVSWETEGASNAYVVIAGDFPYDAQNFPYGFVLQPGLSGQNKTFWTVSGSYTASLYVNGIWPTKSSPGTGTKIREVYFTVFRPGVFWR